MTKAELIKGIQEEVSINIPQKDLAEILDAQAKVVANEVKAGGEVTILYAIMIQLRKIVF